MKRVCFFLILVLFVSCGRRSDTESRIISVSIAPFKYFVEQIAGDKFAVNVMVPAGSNPHIYEPYPDQINKLRQSVAYISDGYLGFEITWLDRFYEINRNMKKLSLSDIVDPIAPQIHQNGGHSESADPHFWVSPECAFRIARSVRDFLIKLDRIDSSLFNENFRHLEEKISEVDSMAKELSSIHGRKEFMIYHPNLAYLSRDYGLKEITVENEGREPSPARLRELIDIAKHDSLKIILVQKEYDTRNARAIAEESGSRVVVIDPLSEDWYSSTSDIISILKDSFRENNN